MTNNNFKNNKTKTAVFLTSFVLGLALISPTAIFPNVNAVPHYSHTHPLPNLSTSVSQETINTALAVAGLQNWSHDWQYAGMAFLGNNKPDPYFQWQYASVTLRAPSSSAPVSCDIDWRAHILVDMTTMKVISADYPTTESHLCHGVELKISNNHTWSIATQNDVNSTTHNYYGDYADLSAPSYLNQVFTDLDNSYVGLVVNAAFPDGITGCTTNTYGECLEQAGWVLSSNGGNSATIVYADYAKNGNFGAANTNLEWINGVTTDVQGEIDCSQGGSDYTIFVQNGTNTFGDSTPIPCTTAQISSASHVTDNSVFFESADNDTTQNWSGDITGSVVAQSATEYNGSFSTTPTAWGTSHNVDETCHKILSASQIITGNLKNSGTVTWSSLSKQPHAC